MGVFPGFTPKNAPVHFLSSKQEFPFLVSNPCGMIDEE
jgi:hypothetical protein